MQVQNNSFSITRNRELSVQVANGDNLKYSFLAVTAVETA